VPAPARINELVRGLLKYRDSLFAFFSKEYREIKRSVKAFLKNPKSFKVKELNDQLESLTDTLNQVENIQKNEGYISALGSLYLGINTNWDRLAAYIDWGQNLSKAIGTERQAHSLISNISEIHQELPNFASIIEEKLKNIEPTKELLNIDEKLKIGECIVQLEENKKKIESSLSIILKYELLNNSDINTIYNAAYSFLESEKVVNEINLNKTTCQSLLGNEYKFLDTDTKKL